MKFATRSLARQYAAKRIANGFPASVVDNGKQDGKSRYSVPILSRNAVKGN